MDRLTNLIKWVSIIVVVLLVLVFALYSFAEDELKCVYKCVETSDKKIALTFDDGPSVKYTETILGILAENDAKATFFVIGENAQNHPELISAEIEAGHEIGSHTFSHKHMRELAKGELEDEIKKTEEVLLKNHSYTPQLFRPPEGVLTKENTRIISDLGYDIVLWSVDTRDWEHKSTENIVNNVMTNINCGSIVLFHDFVSGNSTTPDALRELLPKLKDEGYTFVTVSELVQAN